MPVPEWLKCKLCLWFEPAQEGDDLCCVERTMLRTGTEDEEVISYIAYPESRCPEWTCLHCHDLLDLDSHKDHLECGEAAGEWLGRIIDDAGKP